MEQDDWIAFVSHKRLTELLIENHDLKQKVKELQDETDRLRHRDEHGSRYDPFVRNSGH